MHLSHSFSFTGNLFSFIYNYVHWQLKFLICNLYYNSLVFNQWLCISGSSEGQESSIRRLWNSSSSFRWFSISKELLSRINLPFRVCFISKVMSSLLNTASIWTKIDAAIIIGQEVFLEFLYLGECVSSKDWTVLDLF